LTQGRWSFGLLMLASGKVLAIGGRDTNGPMSSVELYDPDTGLWSSTGSLQTPRAAHTATLLPDGKVLVAGGTALTPAPSSSTPPDPVVASAELYDPVTGEWSFTGSLGQARENHTATLLPNGKVLVAGGFSFFDTVFLTSAEIYDPVTGKWLPTLPLTSGRTEHVAALLPNGKVLFAGGFNTSDTGPTTELFDPASAVATPTLLDGLREFADGIGFRFRNTPGQRFTVLSTANVETPIDAWENAGQAVEASPGHYLFVDAAVRGLRRFYQTRSN
jgi:hypothetical protein